MLRQVLIIVFLVTGALWQLGPVYACPFREGVVLAQCCCDHAAIQEKCTCADWCVNEQIWNAEPCCASIDTPQFIYKEVDVQTKHGNLPDEPALSANTLLAYMTGPRGSVFKQHLWAIDSPWLFGTATYLMTDRLRI
jgi:hypothetical protein